MFRKFFEKYFIVIILLTHQLLIIFIHNVLYPIHFAPKNFFFLELIGSKFDITYELFFILDAANLILLWLISKLIFKNKFSIIPPFIYSIIPWSSYLVAAGSFYVYLLFILLIIVYGLLKIESNKKMGSFLLVGGILGGVYSSFLFLILLPLILCLLSILKLIPFKSLKSLFVISFLLILPLLFLIYTNLLGFKNILNGETQIFSDPGLINTVNSYQGAVREAGFVNLARIAENRYIFATEYIFLKYMKSLVPVTYFTSQEKLLFFSFSPPIYLGFLIPFLYGLYQLITSSILKKAFLVSTFLTIPSILSKPMIDLNRMIIFAPVVIFIITYGIITLYEQRKNKSKKIASVFLMLTMALVIFQLLVILSDISLREKDRYATYYKQDYELEK